MIVSLFILLFPLIFEVDLSHFFLLSITLMLNSLMPAFFILLTVLRVLILTFIFIILKLIQF